MSALKFCREWRVSFFLIFSPPKSSSSSSSWYFVLPLLLCFFSNNVLYPREDREQRLLLFACRNCDHQEIAEDLCVYEMKIDHSVSKRSQVLRDEAADPALPRTRNIRCSNCNHPEAVFFQAPSKGEEGMALFFICCNPNCGHRWRD
ncbi:DNA-directed RNA polymerases II, IV and V subunit 9A-like isoform X2 [Canna indica]|uniref:DNA-directed RNA polymerases II, IV and V subunit 9A-like isoform X2 n=1 Tax=Canna indica TaxID=4628 RepID=A0AAQ3KP31_9LILI|nr:DNA-directed RNA polymerases II, IV and V subunit 9A-like isoform X2 [Canna indica]